MKFRMSARPSLTLLFAIIISVIAGGRAVAAAPAAPSPISPADGASVTEPFTISWTAVSDPSGIVAYNWQVSSSSAFTSVLLQTSTSGATQDEVSGLANGTYFWRVQAVNGAFVQGAWSQPRSFTIMDAGAGSPGTPSLAPTKGYSTFHPWEVITFIWSAVPDAETYVLQYSTDPSFPVASRGEFNNIPNTTQSFAIANPEGNYFARVFAVGASGVFSAPSNVIAFSVFYNNPLPPPPSLAGPTNGTTLTLPVTLTWTDVPNPQPGGYELQIARDSNFSSIELDDPQLDDPTRQILSLTSGT
ncbi:MAG TPA: fibronectin type III domain-containing protein, partial [Blastocatellia bacterium]